MEKVELGTGAEVGEGSGDAIHGIGVGAAADGLRPEMGFDGQEAALAPHGGDHILDGAVLGPIVGFELGKVFVEELFEDFFGFVGEKDALGEETVAECVAGGAFFALRSFGAA
jgi:hypothetical protein